MSKRSLAVLSSAVLLLMSVAMIVPTPADAIPAFSRKYATSCATCHQAFPKLNAFGRAFRNNGYRMPGGDEDYLKDENIKLGADPWKRLWPESIWPSDIPYLPPVAFLIENEFEYSPNEEIKTDFRTPSDVSMLFGGTLGDSMSWYGRINLVAPGQDVHVHQLFGQFNSMFGTSLVNLRVGQMETRAVPISSNQRLAKVDYLLNSASMPLEAWVDYLRGLEEPGHDEEPDHDGDTRVGDGRRGNEDEPGGGDEHSEADPRLALIGIGGHQHAGSFTLGTTQLGVELWGAKSGIGGRGGFEYAVGAVNGNGSGDPASETGAKDNNSAKDVYWRASYKFGGMSVMGDAGSAPAATNNWQDNSIRVGVFGYHGTAPFSLSLEPEPGHDEEGDDHGLRFGRNFASEDDHGDMPGMQMVAANESFRRIGADVDIWWGDLNLYGAYLWGETEMDPVLVHDSDVDYRSWLAQLDYMAYPWLLGSLRYEKVDYDDAFGDVERWVPHVTALLRANVKLNAEASLYTDDDVFRNRYRLWFNFAF